VRIRLRPDIAAAVIIAGKLDLRVGLPATA